MVYLYALIRARVISFTDSLRSKNCLPPLDMIRRREVNERTNERARSVSLSLSLGYRRYLPYRRSDNTRYFYFISK